MRINAHTDMRLQRACRLLVAASIDVESATIDGIGDIPGEWQPEAQRILLGIHRLIDSVGAMHDMLTPQVLPCEVNTTFGAHPRRRA